MKRTKPKAPKAPVLPPSALTDAPTAHAIGRASLHDRRVPASLAPDIVASIHAPRPPSTVHPLSPALHNLEVALTGLESAMEDAQNQYLSAPQLRAAFQAHLVTLSSILSRSAGMLEGYIHFTQPQKGTSDASLHEPRSD